MRNPGHNPGKMLFSAVALASFALLSRGASLHDVLDNEYKYTKYLPSDTENQVCVDDYVAAAPKPEHVDDYMYVDSVDGYVISSWENVNFSTFDGPLPDEFPDFEEYPKNASASKTAGSGESNVSSPETATTTTTTDLSSSTNSSDLSSSNPLLSPPTDLSSSSASSAASTISNINADALATATVEAPEEVTINIMFTTVTKIASTNDQQTETDEVRVSGKNLTQWTDELRSSHNAIMKNLHQACLPLSSSLQAVVKATLRRMQNRGGMAQASLQRKRKSDITIKAAKRLKDFRKRGMSKIAFETIDDIKYTLITVVNIFNPKFEVDSTLTALVAEYTKWYKALNTLTDRSELRKRKREEDTDSGDDEGDGDEEDAKVEEPMRRHKRRCTKRPIKEESSSDDDDDEY